MIDTFKLPPSDANIPIKPKIKVHFSNKESSRKPASKTNGFVKTSHAESLDLDESENFGTKKQSLKLLTASKNGSEFYPSLPDIS